MIKTIQFQRKGSTRDNETPLSLAFKQNKTEMVNALLEHGAIDNEALVKALDDGNIHLFDLMCSHGADLNIQYEGEPLIVKYVSNSEVFKILLAHGVDPNTKNSKDLKQIMGYLL